MSDFICERTRVAAKPHRCYQCRQIIDIGRAHTYAAWSRDGDFVTDRYHQDCHQAWDRVNFSRDCRDLHWDDEAMPLCDDAWEFGEWLSDHFPVVANRLGMLNLNAPVVWC